MATNVPVLPSNTITIVTNMSGLGPMFQRLPAEVILEIFKVFMTVQNLSGQGSSIDNLSFGMLRCFVLQDVCAVSKTFNIFVMQALYSTYTFAFQGNSNSPGLSLYRTTLPPILPPPHVRHLLRRIQINVVLEDTFVLPLPAGQQIERIIPQQITTVNELFTHCHGANTLRRLTNPTTGFSNLGVVDLTVHTRLRFDHQTALNVWQQAGFAVRAQQINIVVQTTRGNTEVWHASVDQAITRMP